MTQLLNCDIVHINIVEAWGNGGIHGDPPNSHHFLLFDSQISLYHSQKIIWQRGREEQFRMGKLSQNLLPCDTTIALGGNNVLEATIGEFIKFSINWHSYL